MYVFHEMNSILKLDSCHKYFNVYVTCRQQINWSRFLFSSSLKLRIHSLSLPLVEFYLKLFSCSISNYISRWHVMNMFTMEIPLQWCKWARIEIQFVCIKQNERRRIDKSERKTIGKWRRRLNEKYMKVSDVNQYIDRFIEYK